MVFARYCDRNKHLRCFCDKYVQHNGIIVSMMTFKEFLMWFTLVIVVFFTVRSYARAEDCVTFVVSSMSTIRGYDELVILKNSCNTKQECQVDTTSRNNVMKVVLQPREKRELVTWHGSSQEEFTAYVSCK